MFVKFSARKHAAVSSLNRMLTRAAPSERLKYKRGRRAKASAESV